MIRMLVDLIRRLRGPWIAVDPNPTYSQADEADGLRHEDEGEDDGN